MMGRYEATPVTQIASKRCCDLIVAVSLIVLLAPLMLMISAMIWLIDGGPVVFRHERVGLGGQKFRCLKFRSMVNDAESRLEHILKTDAAALEEWNTYYKLRDDPRILPHIGRMLRETGLDELPQLFNVLAGDMSMVGPRPVTEAEIDLYYRDHCDTCLSVRPGMTGPWQISGHSDSDYNQRVAQDLEYVRTWSAVRDLRIIVTTARMVLTGGAPGSY